MSSDYRSDHDDHFYYRFMIVYFAELGFRGMFGKLKEKGSKRNRDTIEGKTVGTSVDGCTHFNSFSSGDYTLSIEEERLRQRVRKENDGEQWKEKTSG
ncbi:hypothetical protein L1887_15472 [Cichorium endivia]|nr:hypothetical protein L1887_15472 [Cichorium endivia]